MKARLIFVLLLGFVTALMFVGCEGDLGPQGVQGVQGVQGPQGPQGVAGADGADGQNGAESCLECHGNNQLITAKIFQWENSIHALGGHYQRNSARCAGCHTSQGFLDRIATGAMEASATVEDPLPQNCYTCHNIHQTYTDADWSFTAPDPVTLWVGGATVDIGRGNQCITCHQARVPSPLVPEPGASGTFTVTSSRYGPHHGAQGLAFTGNGGFEIGDGYTNSVHSTALVNACVECHMAPVDGGRAAGGHTFRVRSEDGDLNTSGCVRCHPNESEFETLVSATQTEVADLLETLGTKLFDLGILRSNLESVNASSSAPLELTSTQIGVLWNYQYVREDQSFGVHNYKYIKALLENSIAALN